MRGTNHEAPYYATFTTFLLVPPSARTIPLSTLFSNTLAPCSSLNVADQVSYVVTVTLVTAMVTLTRIEGLPCCGHRQPTEQRDRHSAMTTHHTTLHTHTHPPTHTTHTNQQQLRSRPVCCPFYSSHCASEVPIYWDEVPLHGK